CLACASNAFSSWIIDAPDTTKKAPETTKAAPVRPTRPREIDAERGLRRGALGDGRKRLRVLEGDVRQHLAVEHDARLLQAGHELRVRQPRQPRARFDARDPQRAEVAPAHPASLRRLHHCPLDRLERPLVRAVAPAAETLGELQDAIAAAACLESSLDAHVLTSPTSAIRTAGPPCGASRRGRRAPRCLPGGACACGSCPGTGCGGGTPCPP